MTTTQNSSQVQPEPILTVGTYHGGSVLISKLTLGSESVYVRDTSKGAKFFPLLKDAVLELYNGAVASRVSYKRSCYGRDNADATLKAIVEFLLTGIEFQKAEMALKNNEADFGAASLQDVMPEIRAINKHYNYHVTAQASKLGWYSLISG